MRTTRRSTAVLAKALLLFTGLSYLPTSARGEGDETIGPIKQGFLKTGTHVFARGVGLESQPGKIIFDYPENQRIVQVILYWGLRSSQGDPDIIVNGTKVVGELVGTSTPFPGADTRPYVFRLDVTDKDWVHSGHNELTIEDLKITDTGFSNGAGIVVIGDDGTASTFEARDGADFAYWNFTPPVKTTDRQRFSFPESGNSRNAELILIVADHKGIDQGRMRPSTLEVGVEGTPVQVINNPLMGKDGDSWDTVLVPVVIPPGAKFVEAQLFSDTRTGSTLSPSSFYWLFGSLRLIAQQQPQNLSISGTVYCDNNGNSNIDQGEPGISGAEVHLNCTRGAETIQRTTFTDAGGAYSFGDIPAGSNCTVTVVPTAVLGDKAPTEVCAPLTNIQTSVTDCDFGFVAPPKVGDTVFLDLNGDGAQQDGETGLSGVKVSIVSPAGGGFPGYSSSMVTDANGKYLFKIPGVPGGAALVSTVSIDPATGEAAGKTLTTPNPQMTIPLGPGGMDLARDFGLKPATGSATVGDTVFSDDDGNAVQNGAEKGLAGVTVSITCPSGNGFSGFDATATTDAQGKYTFTVPGIPNGQKVVCTVSIDPATGDAAGKTLTTPNPQDTVGLGPGESDLNRDFGLKPAAKDAVVGDTVFCDLNSNGAQDPSEPGIFDVPVTISAPASGGFPGTNQTARTDRNGKYLFMVSGIPTGTTITATVTIDANSPAAAGKLLTTPNPQTTRALGPGDEDRDRDFGLRPIEARVGDTVFCDRNGNGAADEGDLPLAGVKISIVAQAVGLFGGFSDSAVTDAQGKYSFLIPGIPPDTPVVGRVELDLATLPSGSVLTAQNPQTTIELAPGAEDLNRDFSVTCGEMLVRTCLENKEAQGGEVVPVRILLTSTHPVEGFESAVRHDPAIVALESITIAGTVSEANMADFTSFEVLPTGGTAAVIMDLEAPFNGNTIPAGVDLPVVVFNYRCATVPDGAQDRTTALEFVDGLLGTPPKDNSVVIGGQSFTPTFCNGSITCKSTPAGNGPCFLCGGSQLGADKLPVTPRGAPGDKVELCFYYCSPEDNLPGHPQFDHLQALSIAVSYDCRLECIESSFRTPPDSMTDALQAEFISFQCENDPNDGDGCEMILAILVDAVEPFDGRTFPPTEIPFKLGCVDMKIADSVSCGTCLPIRFQNGVNGRGRIRIKNLYVAENQSFPPRTVDCEICVTGTSGFRRGDCNADGKANLPDAAAIISSIFAMGSERFLPTCQDACDANDDGRMDVADAVKILTWIFGKGTAPPDPGPVTPGPDPTPDKLQCELPGCPQ